MDRYADAPIYEQLYRNLKDWFVRSFEPEQKLPTEQDIMQRYDVGRGTVRAALNELVREGLIIRSAGRGSFLASDFRVRLKRYAVGILLSEREFSGSDTWEYTWHNHMEMLNGAMKEALHRNVSLEIIPEGAISRELNESFDAFLCFRYVGKLRLSMLKKPVIPFHYELDLAGGLAGIVRHVTGCGYGRPAYVGTARAGRIGLINSFLRMNGTALLPEIMVAECSGTVRDGYEACSRLLERGAMPDCIICSTDMRAMGVLQCLRDRGLSVPGDVGVCGFDGMRESGCSTPSLTTWAFPWQELGVTAVRELRSSLDGESPAPYEPLKGELVVRESTASASVQGRTGRGRQFIQMPEGVAGPEEAEGRSGEYWSALAKSSGLGSCLERCALHLQSLSPEEPGPDRRIVSLPGRDLDFSLTLEEGERVLSGSVPFDFSLGEGREFCIRPSSGRRGRMRFDLIPGAGWGDEEARIRDALALAEELPGSALVLQDGSEVGEGFFLLPGQDLPLTRAAPMEQRWEGTVTGAALDYPLPVLRLSGPEPESLILRVGRSLAGWLRLGDRELRLHRIVLRQEGLFSIFLIVCRASAAEGTSSAMEQLDAESAAGDIVLPGAGADGSNLPKLPDRIVSAREAAEMTAALFDGFRPADGLLDRGKLFGLLWDGEA